MKGLSDVFACDLRALALFRMLLAAAVAAGGIVNDAPLALIVLVPATTLFIGFRSYWSAFTCWLLIAALHILHPASAHDASALLIAMLFLSIFLPIGARYSIDSALDLAHAPDAPTSLRSWQSSPRHISSVTVALTIVVLFAVVLAASQSLETNATQLYSVHALNIVALASTMPILLPAFGGWLRFVALLILLTALIVAAPQLESGISLITIVAGLVALLPACLWNWLTAVIGSAGRSKTSIYFDRDCGFCRKTCYLFRTFLVLGDASIKPAQSNEGVLEIMQREVSWVVYDYNGKVYIRWHAVLLLLRRSPVFWPFGWLLTALGMGYWGDPIYRAIGASRWWLSKLTAFVLPYRRERTPAGSGVAMLAGIWLVASLYVTVLPSHALNAGKKASMVVCVLALDQRRPVW